jgi:hypothetical protein
MANDDDESTTTRQVAGKTAEYPEITAPPRRAEDDDWAGDEPPPVTPAIKVGGGPMRGLFWLVATIALVVAVALGAKAVGFWPSIHNPFGSQTTDRSQPALLKSVQDLNQFVAAEGNFQVIVDVQHDRKYIPDFLVNERILFIAAGSVEVYVDFSKIGQGAVTESADRHSATITLPAPQLRPVRLDNDKSYVYEEDRGALNRIGDVFKNDPNRMQQVYQAATQKIGDAAKDAGLGQRAEANTRAMLQQFLKALGYTSVTVTFPAS